jgi:hypothetical protein
MQSSTICVGHVSAERVVSGWGLENLYRAVVAIDGVDAPERSAPEITKAGSDGACQISRMALELFCGMLGTIAGNVGPIFGARGGVYIAGGIAPRITDFIAHSCSVRKQRSFPDLPAIHTDRNYQTSCRYLYWFANPCALRAGCDRRAGGQRDPKITPLGTFLRK